MFVDIRMLSPQQQMKEMEGEIEKFQKERDELVAQMQNVRSVNNNNK